jgi:hypothetical protein
MLNQEIEGDLVADHLSPEEAAAEMMSGGAPRFNMATVADLVRSHPYWSLAAALAAGMVLGQGAQMSGDVGLKWPSFLRRRGGRKALTPPAPPPPDPATQAAADAAAPADDDSAETMGRQLWPNIKGMAYLSSKPDTIVGFGGGFPGFRRGRPFRGRVRSVPRHFMRLSPWGRTAVLGSLARMPAECSAALYGALDDGLIAPAVVKTINRNPSGPALLRALSDWHRYEHAKTAGRVAMLGWSMPWSSNTTKLLVSAVPYGSTAIAAHEVAAQAIKNGDLKPSWLQRAGRLVGYGKRGDRASLAKIAAVKAAAGRGSRVAEKALDTIKLAHAMSRGPSGGFHPRGTLNNTYRQGLATLKT